MWRIVLYETFYAIIHCLFTGFEYVFAAYQYLYKIFILSLYEFLFPGEKRAQMRRLLEKIRNKPKHLTVLLGPGENEIADLVNLIIWCLGAQISFISFYDYEGNLKSKEEKLQEAVSKKSGKMDEITWHTDVNSNIKNGYSGKKICIKIITLEESRNNAVDVTKEILHSGDRDFSVENIHKHFHKQFKFPDPEMAILCGLDDFLYNYPAWYIRLTEFFWITTIKGITYVQFLELLVKFSQREQRLGR